MAATVRGQVFLKLVHLVKVQELRFTLCLPGKECILLRFKTRFSSDLPGKDCIFLGLNFDISHWVYLRWNASC